MEKNRERMNQLPAVSRNLLETSRHFNRLFDDWFQLAPFGGWMEEPVFGEVSEFPEVEERDDHYLMSIDLPGVPKDNIQVELTGNRITIRAHRENRSKEGQTRTRGYGRYERTLTLPEEIDASKVEADYRDGVLNLAFPKSPTAQARTIPIGQAKEGILSRWFGESKSKELPIDERKPSGSKAA